MASSTNNPAPSKSGDASVALETVWILGDQLNRFHGALADRSPGDCRVLLVTSTKKLASKRWHRQRLHLVLSAMAHFAAELRAEGFDVDHREASTLRAGLDDHCVAYNVTGVVAMEPMSWDGRAMLHAAGVTTIANTQFLCHYDQFAAWAAPRKTFKMEDFYRWQRARLGILMEPDGEPCGGRWNFDHDNREPPPSDGRAWPTVTHFGHDDIDRAVLDQMEALHDASTGAGPGALWGDEPHGLWPVTRDQALTRLNEFITTGLAPFGAHEDAMLRDEWKLAHSVLAASMNLGLLHPAEIAEAAEAAWRSGQAPMNSVEGFIRQVIGWREYVWGVYWLWMPQYRHANTLHATRPVPPAFTGEAETKMACVATAVRHVEATGYTHHIERLMVLGNLALTAGVDPQAMTDWMWASFVDGAEWVMLPNVIGMALHADGGLMATKPYASGGAYINKMSDNCKQCFYDPKKRVGDNACPFTTLYWDFLDRNADAFSGNHRLSRPLAGLRRLSNLDDVRARAVEVLHALDAGTL